MNKKHLRLDITGPAYYACGADKVWKSKGVSSVRNPTQVDCNNCARTKAYKRLLALITI